MIIKPDKINKSPTHTIIYKIFARILLGGIRRTTALDDLVLNHQFAFRQRHSTIQQCHRIVNKIRESFEDKK